MHHNCQACRVDSVLLVQYTMGVGMSIKGLMIALISFSLLLFPLLLYATQIYHLGMAVYILLHCLTGV